MVQIGNRVTRRVLKARWAYSELTSTRVGYKYEANYKNGDNTHVFEYARANKPFEELDESDTSHLVTMNEHYRAGFQEALATSEVYECAAWTKDELSRVLTIPVLDPQRKNRNVPFLSYAIAPPFRRPDGTVEMTDPRAVAETIPLDKRTLQHEPVPAIRVNGRYMLLDGYLRSILFMRSEDPDATLLAWIPQ